MLGVYDITPHLLSGFASPPLDGRGVASCRMFDVLQASVLPEVLTVWMCAERTVSNFAICFLELLSCVRVFPTITMGVNEMRLRAAANYQGALTYWVVGRDGMQEALSKNSEM
jgi:hypothetical protein